MPLWGTLSISTNKQLSSKETLGIFHKRKYPLKIKQELRMAMVLLSLVICLLL